MTNAKSLKRALLTSIIALIVCFTMLIGSTFAWFTDSTSSKNNIIVAGNLDVELYWSKTAAEGSWQKVDENTNVFDDSLWEPGKTEVVYLKVVNEGTLSLKYNFGVSIFSETAGTNVDGEEFNLSDYILYGVTELEQPVAYANRADALAVVAGDATELNVNYSKSGKLLNKGDVSYVAMVVFMPSTVGNVANYRGATAPKIELGIDLFATQQMNEQDSFGNDYDKGAPWTGEADTTWYFDNPDANEFTISSGAELAGLASIVNGTAEKPASSSTSGYAAYTNNEPELVKDNFKGKTIKLGANINLNNLAWTPIGNSEANILNANFDGQGYTVSNFSVNTYGWAGLIGHAGKGSTVTINNVNVENVTISANRLAGGVVGQIYGSMDNCSATNVNITAVPNVYGDSFDNGDKVGGIVGWLGDNDNNHTLSNCSVNNVTLKAYRDVGGIAGYVANSNTVSGNTVDGEIKIYVDQITNFYGEKDHNASLVCGRLGTNVVMENNSANEEEAVISATYSKNGATIKKDGLTDDVKLHVVPEDYSETTFVVPEGVTSIGGYAFAYNSNIEKITLPSTVTTLNDRAFRDTSASEVVLNEGLENISYQAFRNALSVTSVEIPSTVTTISKEAFQNSGITSLTIPENVTTLEYGACRDMKKLVSVTIEGNVDIPVYAFRACTELREVIITGDNVTFGGGSRGMIFTNKENGDGSAITVYVKNETVKERLLAADTAAKDYGGYKIVVLGIDAISVSNADELNAALTAASNTEQDVAINIVIISGFSDETIMMPATLNNVTIKGTAGAVLKNVTISAADGNSYSYVGLTFDGITFENSRIVLTGWRNGDEIIKDLTVTNCVFKNLNDDSNNAPLHINKDAAEAVQNLTFTNNVIDGATGGKKSGVYAQVTGKVVFTGNVINNVSFRPYVIQITNDDGIDDEFIVTGNVFSGSAAGRAQGLGSNDEGTDNVKLVVSENIFKDITESQQICYWNFNAEKTTTDFSKNYYSIDITANTNKIYYNSAAENVEDLIAKSVTSYYAELNEDGTINKDSLVVLGN